MLKKIYLSIIHYKLFILLMIPLTLLIAFNAQKYPEKLIWSDMEGYYNYLPSVFIYGDFTIESRRDTGYVMYHPETGKLLNKYTSGVAIMHMPVFLVNHALVKILKGNSDGKNYQYGYGLIISGLLYFWLGCLFLFKYLSRYVEKHWAYISIALIALGTNLYYYTFFQPAMSHVYSFFLFAFFLFLVDKIFVHRELLFEKKLITWMILGFVVGMIVLVRPTNIIMMILPIYIWAKNENDKLLYLKDNMLNIILGAIMALSVFIPQMFYWHHVSGSWFIWSYSNEGFTHWKEPKLFRVLFDAWNGWILYSPIVLFPLYQLWKGRYTNVNFERFYIFVLALSTYIFASWWAWWFGGAFGHRSYVEYLALLALPLALLLKELPQNKGIRYATFFVLVILCYYNLGLTYAYTPPWDGPEFTYATWWSKVKQIFFIP